MSGPTQPTLYERLGGVYGIAVVVDDFIDRVMTDPRLNANQALELAFLLADELKGLRQGGFLPTAAAAAE